MVPNQDLESKKKDELYKALATVADVVVGKEFTNLRKTIADTNNTVANDVDRTRQTMMSLADSLRKEMGQFKHDAALNHNTLVKRIEQEATSRANALNNIEKSTEEEVTAQNRRLLKRIESLEKTITEQNQVIKAHQQEVSQVSQILNNFAGVFAGSGMFRSSQPSSSGKSPSISDFVKPTVAQPEPKETKQKDSEVIDEAIITHVGTKRKIKL